MNMQFLNQNGNLLSKKDLLKKTPHKNNLDYLKKNPGVKAVLMTYLYPIVTQFLNDAKQNSSNAYLHSANVASTICNAVGYPNTPKHHGLVGSLLLDYLEQISPLNFNLPASVTIVASKAQDQRWFDYFADKNSLRKTFSVI